MPRTPVSTNLVHSADEVANNARLIDEFIEMLTLDPLKGYTDNELRELIGYTGGEMRQIVASQLLEKIRFKVMDTGEVRLPFGLVIKRNPRSEG